MAHQIKTLGALLLALSLATPALADVQVSLDPAAAVVEIGQTVDVDIVATFSDPVMAWGLDATLSDPSLGTWAGLTIDPLWDPSDSLDGDGLAGLVFPTGVSGEVLLATLTFEAGMTEGVTDVTLSYGPEEDEGFLLVSGVLDDVVTYVPGTIEVVPEPATLMLLLSGIALVRRR
jgi:hypothetical protein